MKVDLPYIKEQAQKLIDTYALTIPVHVFELADLMGVKWKTATTAQIKKLASKKQAKAQSTITNWEDVLGFFNDEIILNDDNNPITRKRFTMAHEIGHKVLHHNENNFDQKIFLRQDIVIPRDNVEAEANYFAGYLLMPDKSIENRLKYAVLMSPGEPVIKAFAEMFAVSTEAMRIRFKTFKQEFPEVWTKFSMDEKLF